ncbi:MAG TPA: response regulator transcription factor [Burkholderiaceae bacterium]|nr:response regulator transcription factor [Burkholderiaceae bacterium]
MTSKVFENRPERGILIVDDQDLMRQTLREFLQRAYPDRHIAVAGDGALALELARALRPRLVVMDIHLPDADGIELTAHIRRTLPEVAVVVMSQHDGSAFREKAQAAGALGFIAKERIHADLLPLAARVLAGRSFAPTAA